MKIPRPKPRNPVPPPAQAHRDARRAAEREACRPPRVREYLNEDAEAGAEQPPLPPPAPARKKKPPAAHRTRD